MAAAGALSGSAGSVETRLGETRLPALYIQKGAPATSADDPDWSRAFAYTFLNLTDDERAELESQLEIYRSRLEASVNPLFEDLEDGAPRDVMTGWTRHHGPLLQAAYSLATPRVSLADGSGVVEERKREACPAGSCLGAWGAEAEDADQRHARFAMWPVAAAMVVRIEDPLERRCARRELRARVPRLLGERRPTQDEGISLVLAGEEDEPVRPDETALVSRVLRLEVAAQMRSAREHGRTAETPTMPSAYEVALDRADLLVVPRLRALASWNDFVRITREAIARCTHAETVFAPLTFP